MELNREQIVKALECCTSGINHKGDIPCLDCPYDECNIVGGTSERQITGTCQSWLKKDALALIKELTEENERLRKRNITLEQKFVILEREEVPVLTLKFVEHDDPVGKPVECGLRCKCQADTVRKMQERLTTFFANDETLEYTEVDAEYINEQIVRIAKEMMEEEK